MEKHAIKKYYFIFPLKTAILEISLFSLESDDINKETAA